MKFKNKRRALQGLVGGVGVVAALGGFVGRYYSPQTAIVVTVGIWIIGSTLVILLTDPDT